ncbi:MAG: cellulase family glycosylhydrolase [Clostridium sp.]|nr:cellulase family glycosylhydrolase [Clostridium sp.]
MKLKKGFLKAMVAVVLSIVTVISLIPQPMQSAAAEMTPVQIHGKLSVNGTQIVDKNGNPFQLRGISTHGINWDIGSPYVNQAAFQTLRDDWGANAVRLAMYTHEYNGYCAGGDQTSLKNLLHNGVEAATNLGMYVIIDWHVLQDRNPLVYLEQSKTFFNEISKKYKNYDNVIYEICNEPNGNDVTWDVIKSYANTIIPIIRANDPDAIIIVGTPTWSQLGMQGHTNEVADSPLIGYSNIVYALHFYCAESSHTQYLPSKVDYAVSKGLPIIVSEFGMSEASGNGRIDTNQATNWFNKLDEYKIGYFCWSLSNKSESASLISSSCSKTSGWTESDLTSAGKFIRSQYRARKEVVIDETARKNIEAFVTRLYDKCLDREPDETGMKTWPDMLMSKNATGAYVAKGFVYSDEYVGKNVSDEEYLNMLYRVFLDREADAEGRNTWLGLMEQGLSRDYVFRGFVESPEYTSICQSYGIERGTVTLTQPRDKNPNMTKFVNRLYAYVLERNGEADGLNDWCQALQNKLYTPVQVGDFFVLSPEFQAKNLNDEEYIKVLYRAYLGREYDEEGLNTWMNQLASGKSREEVLRGFTNSVEFRGIINSFGL